MQTVEPRSGTWELTVIFHALFPRAVCRAPEFEHGQFVIGPGNRWTAFTRDEDLHRNAHWEDALRSLGRAEGIDATRIERMIDEAKRARRAWSSPYFGSDAN